MHLKPITHAALFEPVEPIDAEVFTPGQHAYLVLNGMTLAEAVKMCFIARIAVVGDNVSPAMTLKHAGEVCAAIGADVDDGYVTTMVVEPMTMVDDTQWGKRKSARRVADTLVHPNPSAKVR